MLRHRIRYHKISQICLFGGLFSTRQFHRQVLIEESKQETVKYSWDEAQPSVLVGTSKSNGHHLVSIKKWTQWDFRYLKWPSFSHLKGLFWGSHLLSNCCHLKLGWSPLRGWRQTSIARWKTNT